MGRKVKNYTDEFKKQIVALNKNGKTIVELAKKYELEWQGFLAQKIFVHN